MTDDPYPLAILSIVAVFAVGIVSFVLFFILSTRINKERNSAYLAPGLLAACLLGPTTAIIMCDILSGWCFRRMGLVSISDFRNVNKPLFCGLVLALLLCGGSTLYFRLMLSGKACSSISKSKKPMILSIAVLAASAVPFLMYHRVQTLVLRIISPNNQFFAGRSPQSIALEISTYFLFALCTSLLAAAVIAAVLIACVLSCIRSKGIPSESHILLMYSGDLAILLGIIAMTPWFLS